MTEETMTQAPPERPAFTPVPPRGVLKTGMPTDGYWLIAGLPKGGKTKLAASIPGAYIIETEQGGADRVSGWIQDVRDLLSFKHALAWGFKEPTVKTIVIDTLDGVLRWMGVESANKYGLDSLSEKREGVNTFAVWEDLFGKVDRMTETFKNCGKLVVVMAHFKEPKLDSDGKLVITQSIDAPSSKISSHICSHADVIGVCSKKRIGEKSQYRLHFHGEGVVGAYGSRVPELEDKTVVLPATGQWAAIEALFKPDLTHVDKEIKPTKTETKAPVKAAPGGKR